MRVGANPAKADPSLVKPYGSHRVIVPVYIPHQGGYFERALEVTLLSLESLHLTTGEETAVTVVSNGCDEVVVQELNRLHQVGWIDQLVIDRHNRGKVNAVMSVVRGCHEPFVTIADADILYFPGWVQKVSRVFKAFPECGYVSPLPVPKPNSRHASATFIGAWLRRELHVESLVPLDRLQRHAKIMGKDFVYDLNREGHFVVRRGDVVASVGSVHMILTMRREVAEYLPSVPFMKFDKAEEYAIDQPADVAGYWRLSLCESGAFHIGNVPDEWIYERMEEVRRDAGKSTPSPVEAFAGIGPSRRHWSGKLPWKLRREVARWLRRRLAPQAARALFDKLP